MEVFQNFPALFNCKCTGSRPQAELVWELGSEPYSSSGSRIDVSEEDPALYDTTSTLRLKPTRDHHNQLIKCLSAVGTIVNKTQITLLVVGKYNSEYTPFVSISKTAHQIHSPSGMLK